MELRDWISFLEARGEVRRITAEVDWSLELGAIARLAPVRGVEEALLFETIRGYREGRCRRLFTGGLGTLPRIAMAIGLPGDIRPDVLVKTVKERFSQRLEPILVSEGPVQENLISGKNIDLKELPVPLWNMLDGGRYINTFCGIVTRDLDSGALNVGLYRGMIASRRSIAVYMSAAQHWGKHFARYRSAGKSMPVAVVIGAHDTLVMAAAAPVNHPDCSEYEIAGALTGHPLELIRCQTSDLLVPARAEIVLEGSISADPETFAEEGPLAEVTGYYGGMASPKHTIQVERMYHRHDPIFRGTLAGMSPGRLGEGGFFQNVNKCAVAWQFLEQVGVPGVLDVWSPPVTCGTNLRVKIKKHYRGHAQHVANALWCSPVAVYSAKNVLVVDEDIDIHDEEAVQWAIAHRVNVEMGDLVTFPGTIGSSLDPSVPLEARDLSIFGHGRWTRVLVDATINWELPRQEQYSGERYPPLATAVDPATEELVSRRWSEYGLDLTNARR